jgi:hypothetical protein
LTRLATQSDRTQSDLTYPSTTLKALDITPSNNTPCLITIATSIPKSKVFRFENFWLLNDQFMGILSDCWAIPLQHVDCAKSLTAKFQNLRLKLKEWQASKIGLHTLIANARAILQFVEFLGDFRDLSVEEWNFKDLLKNHLLGLLEQQRVYWKQRGAIKWVKLGDASTKFFHANAAIRYRGNLITELVSSNGVAATDHREKEQILWEDFKFRLGTSEFSGFIVNPSFFI